MKLKMNPALYVSEHHDFNLDSLMKWLRQTLEIKTGKTPGKTLFRSKAHLRLDYWDLEEGDFIRANPGRMIEGIQDSEGITLQLGEFLVKVLSDGEVLIRHFQEILPDGEGLRTLSKYEEIPVELRILQGDNELWITRKDLAYIGPKGRTKGLFRMRLGSEAGVIQSIHVMEWESN